MGWFQRFSRRGLPERHSGAELQFHLDQHPNDEVARGMSQQQTGRARVEFAGLNRVGGVGSARFIETFLQDVRYGLRLLAKNPGFTAVAVLMLALGIGASTVIFSVVSGVLLRKPPVKDSDRVVMVLSINRAKGWGDSPEHPVSAPDFLDWRKENHVFEEMAVADEPWGNFSLTGQGEPQRVIGTRVSANYFHLLRVNAALGRTFAEGEDEQSRDHVAILSNALWQTHFGSDRNVAGKTVKLNGETYTIVGVTPSSFKLMIFPTQVWIPVALDSKELDPAGRKSRSFYVFGRLKPGVTIEQAQAEMTTITHGLEQDYPESDKGWDAALIPLQEFQIQDYQIRPALMLMMGAVAFMLLIVCANLAGLLVARGVARQHEIAIRAALGAGRWRLVRQMLSEDVLIALAGAGFGLLFASLGITLLHAVSYNEWVKALEFGIDEPVLIFTLALSLVTVLLFGLAPALQICKPDLQATLKEGGRTGRVGGSRSIMRRVLVVGESALALVLLTGAGLMIKSFLEMISANPGFDPRQLLTVEIPLTSSKYQEASRQAAFFGQTTGSILNLPGVVSAAPTATLPMAAEAGRTAFSLEGQPPLRPEERPQAAFYVVGPRYFQTLRIPLIKGRTFTNADNASAPPVALVNETFASRFFPGREPIGQHVVVDTGRPGERAWREIIGVVGNVKDFPGQAGYNSQIYETYLQYPVGGMTLVVRTKSNPAALAPAVRSAIWSLDKDQPLGNVMTMTEVIDARGEGGDRLMGELLGILAGLALALTAVGIYGITTHIVVQRTHEIGIRVALGARKRDVLGLVVREGMKLVIISLAIGCVAAYPLPRVFANVFQGFDMQAGWIFVITPAVVAMVGLLANYIPARRATEVDPMVALRYQ
jgi:putative ABC transport system permease protein